MTIDGRPGPPLGGLRRICRERPLEFEIELERKLEFELELERLDRL